MNCSPNSVKFIDRITALFPASAMITIPIMTIIPNLMNLPVSGGGFCLSVEALYKININCGLVN